MDHFFKVFIEFVTILFLFYVLVFWPPGILVPWLGIKLALHALEGEFLTTGQPGMSPNYIGVHCKNSYVSWLPLDPFGTASQSDLSGCLLR